MLKAAKDSPAQGRRTPRTQSVLTASQPSVPRLQWDEEARPLSEAVPFCTFLPLASCDPLPAPLGGPNTRFLSQWLCSLTTTLTAAVSGAQ